MTSFETILKAKDGDLNARNQIILENLGIIKKIANACQRDRFEDAVQDGVFGVIRAIKTYDVTKGGFNTYMGLWVRRTMQERTGYREDTTLDASATIHDDDGESFVVNHDIPVEVQDTVWLKEAIDKLDDREKLVIDLIYFHDATLVQIAEVLSVSKVTVNKIHQTALKKLREVLS